MAISLIWQEIRRYGEMAIPPCFSLYYHINPPRGGIVISDMIFHSFQSMALAVFAKPQNAYLFGKNQLTD